MTQEESKESGRGQSLALAAALAMLGLSVGVNVQALLAAAPTDGVSSNQNKIAHEGFKRDATQIKKESLQQKVPAMQEKQRMMPGLKPGDPPRP